MTATALTIRDLNVSFDLPAGETVHAVQGVSLDVRAGERFGLVGESGCGKTTTVLSIMGLLPSTANISGEIYIHGTEILSLGEDGIRQHRWKDVAIVFQGAMNALNPVLSVGDQILEALEVHDVAHGGTARQRVRELLELVGISGERANRYPHEFSGGMRQRAAIAMALACEPKIVLADEPTTALDVMIQAQILGLLQKLSEELGLTLILVTHDLPVVAELCQRAAVMYAGSVAEVGRVDDLYYEPRHPYTRLLFEATPDLYDEGKVVSIPGAPPSLHSTLRDCPFAPRCPWAFDRCRRVRPKLVGVGIDHFAACHLNDSARSDLTGPEND